MPYTVTHNNYQISQILPQNLKHKPIYAIPYESFDGMFAGKTDAKYLSVGISQWSGNHISAKVMRFIGNRWSRQAEELPINRSIDLSILIAKALFDASNNAIEIRGDTFLNQHHRISVTQEARTSGEQAAFDKFVDANSQLIKDRLNSLCDVLLDLRRRGKI